MIGIAASRISGAGRFSSGVGRGRDFKLELGFPQVAEGLGAGWV